MISIDRAGETLNLRVHCLRMSCYFFIFPSIHFYTTFPNISMEVYHQSEQRQKSELNGRRTVQLTPQESKYLRSIKEIDPTNIPNKVKEDQNTNQNQILLGDNFNTNNLSNFFALSFL